MLDFKKSAMPSSITETLPPARDHVLDFWRGMSILGVISHHLFYYHFPVFRDYIYITKWGSSVISNVLLLGDKVLVAFSYRSGPLGVRVFFVISGFIITKLLLDEEKKNGRINVGRFYFRRIFRILPAYFFYLACLALFGVLGLVVLNTSEIPYAAAFLCNTSFVNCGWYLVHSWSLAIEEQFYLFWPLLFLIIKPRFRGRFLSVSLILCVLLSSFGVFVTHSWIDNPLAFACIAIGALYAVSDMFSAFVQKYSVIVSTGIIAALGLLAIAPSTYLQDFSHLAYREVTPFLILTCIVLTYSFQRFINSLFFRVLTKVGLISYSLYIWQQVFLGDPSIYPAGSFLRMWYLMFPIAILSYLFIEKPLIAWAKQYLRSRARRHTPPELSTTTLEPL